MRKVGFDVILPLLHSDVMMNVVAALYAAVSLWSVADVTEWLGSKNLSQYAPNFLQNEINGSVLMDISLEDLDYMGITILGHRKTILKGIEEISSGKVKVGHCNPIPLEVNEH